MIDFVFSLLVELLGHSVARVVFPLFSFGRITVQPLWGHRNDPLIRVRGAKFNRFGYRRDPWGRIEMSSTVAASIGWLVCFVAGLIFYMRS